jgi:hypothetical protein
MTKKSPGEALREQQQVGSVLRRVFETNKAVETAVQSIHYALSSANVLAHAERAYEEARSMLKSVASPGLLEQAEQLAANYAKLLESRAAVFDLCFAAQEFCRVVEAHEGEPGLVSANPAWGKSYENLVAHSQLLIEIKDRLLREAGASKNPSMTLEMDEPAVPPLPPLHPEE